MVAKMPAEPRDATAPLSRSIAAIAALDDHLRRSMYRFVRQAHRPVSRDEAAAMVGISRKLAAFHLDKLVSVGLLRADLRPRTEPGKVGRRPKVYVPTDRDVLLTIPQRCHDLLAGLLIDAVQSERADEDARTAALRVARERGERLGLDDRASFRPGRLDTERTLAIAEQTLAEYGFEPQRSASVCLRLRNCPFHPLAAKAPQLVCGMTHAFLCGYLVGLAAPATVQAALVPHAGECCVEIRSVPSDQAPPETSVAAPAP
jgi:predicted ArsR family transcriptional regulator